MKRTSLRDVMIVIAVIVSLFFTMRGYVRCRARGGAYVRGVIGMECIVR